MPASEPAVMSPPTLTRAANCLVSRTARLHTLPPAVAGTPRFPSSARGRTTYGMERPRTKATGRTMSQAATVAVANVSEVSEADARRLFIGSCVALGATAMMFAVLSDILNPLKQQFVLTNEQVGVIAGAGWGFTVAIF